MTKSEIRKAMKARRAEINQIDRYMAGESILKIASDPRAANLFARYRTFATFLDFGSEVSTEPINAALMVAGKPLCVPRWSDTEQAYHWAPLALGTPLRVGHYGVREPLLGARFPRGEIDIVLIPGLAFDTRGGRIGFGAGFYDRLLKGLRPTVLKVGLAFDFQIADEPLPQDEHDIPMDLIITESSWIDAQRARRADHENWSPHVR